MPKTTMVTPDATTTSKGKIQLAGDLAGTATGGGGGFISIINE